jgi:hypothetical protein
MNIRTARDAAGVISRDRIDLRINHPAGEGLLAQRPLLLRGTVHGLAGDGTYTSTPGQPACATAPARQRAGPEIRAGVLETAGRIFL